ncbi:MAG TPA: hypothetical protein VFE62_17190 [Gemmataceae bacterium]|nr:hypothetical protein [Gemmataceae bacterium]
MKIFGVSQSSGIERQLRIERGIEGVVLTITDTAGQHERGWISVPAESLLTAIIEPGVGGTTVVGLRQPNTAKTTLNVEVRRNEVQLAMHPGDQADIAVGLDDLQDALEGVINRS